MAVNIEQLPQQIRDDVEDQSLDILQQIQQHIVVIGGWAVRSYTAKSLEHARYTLDVDAVATPKNIKIVNDLLVKENLMFSEEKLGHPILQALPTKFKGFMHSLIFQRYSNTHRDLTTTDS